MNTNASRAILVRNFISYFASPNVYLFICGYVFLFLVPTVLVTSIFKTKVELETLHTMINDGALRQIGLCMMLFALIFFPLVGWIMTREHEQFEKWGRLQIEE